MPAQQGVDLLETGCQPPPGLGSDQVGHESSLKAPISGSPRRVVASTAGPVLAADHRVEDLLAVMVRALDDPGMRGTYHLTSPNPVTNAEMMRTYRQMLGRRVGLPGPALGARVAAPIMGVALTGRRCVPRRLLEEGYDFSTRSFKRRPGGRSSASGRSKRVGAALSRRLPEEGYAGLAGPTPERLMQKPAPSGRGPLSHQGSGR